MFDPNEAETETYHRIRDVILTDDPQHLSAFLDSSGIGINKKYLIHPDDIEAQAALHIAASKGKHRLVKLLLDRGAEVDLLDVNRDGDCTPLFYAAFGGHFETVRTLLEAHADIHRRCLLGATPLHAVLFNKKTVTHDHKAVLELLLDRGAMINLGVPEVGGTVVRSNLSEQLSYAHMTLQLQMALRLDQLDVVQLLMAREASLDGSLKFAKNSATVDFLRRHGVCDIDHAALLGAVAAGKLDVVQALIQSYEIPTKYRSKALSHAALNGQLAIVAFLLERGFDANGRDSTNRTPLHSACLDGRPRPVEIVQTLIQWGADVAAQDSDPGTAHWPFCGGNTPLHFAAWHNDLAVIRSLLTSDPAIVHIANDAGQTPLIHFAANINRPSTGSKHPRPQSLNILIDGGANITSQDKDGNTALHVIAAIRMGDKLGNRLKAVKLLVERGANTGLRNAKDQRAVDLLEMEQRDEELRKVLNSR